ncbi:uncharacterized protein J4E84_007450 [Alternaria hordeiaustralica]|uniref:uncharacterized protein n=1 Tax=Alternaria hordeiaustralica TaxID=1187925 RepID=UPI0020C37B66|nr:uncharacterized protein J4E84_007450 [Alternaria hordeiaustralica]KAI4681853.1 hypothetical protein J4E84_007450 [Alternaria hordeiaustralica]
MSASNQQQQPQTQPRISAPNTTMAEIIVGPKAKRFTVQLNRIVYYSPFFLAALTGPFKEAKDKVVTLPDTEANIFELFVHWLYHQRFPTQGDSPRLLALYSGGDRYPYFESARLMRLYVFSDKYNIPKLNRDCLDALFEHVGDSDGYKLPDLNDVAYAVKNLNDEDPLLRMIVDGFCYYGNSVCWETDQIQKLPLPFIARLMRHMSDFRDYGMEDVKEPELCDYHGHASSEEREACENRREMEEQAREMIQD